MTATFLPRIEGEHEGHKFNWLITIKPASYPISHEKIRCTQCGGACRPCFGMIDDPVDCSFCNNTGQIDKPIEWNPTPPQELVDSLRKVVLEYWNKQQNDNFALVG